MLCCLYHCEGVVYNIDERLKEIFKEMWVAVECVVLLLRGIFRVMRVNIKCN